MSFLIGIAGRARSGKDTVATHLVVQYDYIQMALADPIRNGIASLFCLTDADLSGERKEQMIEHVGYSPRQLMQLLGTEFGRQIIGDDVWLRILARRIDLTLALWRTEGWRASGIVVSDIRFENEAAWIRQHGGVIFHIQREARDQVHPHASEAGIEHSKGDYLIRNNGSLNELYSRVDGVMNVICRLNEPPQQLHRVH